MRASGAIHSLARPTCLVASLVASVATCPLVDVGTATVAAQAVDGGEQTQVSISADLSADTVAIGDAFELHVTLMLPPGRTAYFPDSLEAADGFGPLGRVEWTAEPASDGSSLLSLAYPLVAFDVGIVTTPEFEIFTGPTPPSDASNTPLRTNTARAGNIVGSWDSLRDELGRQGQTSSLERIAIPSQRLWVASVLLLDDITQGLEPRPAADVTGGNWHWPSLIFIVASTFALGGVLMLSVGDLIGRDAELGADAHARSLSPLEVALDAMDRLLASGLHSDGRVKTFYAHSSDIVRRYVETWDSVWGSAQTSTELMRVLDHRATERADPGLLAEMRSAETVKFGRRRPDAAAAETHAKKLRTWIERSGSSAK